MLKRILATLSLGCLMAATGSTADDSVWSSLDSSAPQWVAIVDTAPAPPSDSLPLASQPVAEAAEESPAPVDPYVYLDPNYGASQCDGPLACDACGCDGTGGCKGGGCGGGLLGDEPLLNDLRGQTLFGNVKYSIGGELRYRYLDERNRLRPMGTAGRDTYQQWRFTPFLEVGNDWIKGYVQAIDAPTYGEDLPILPIDVNRFDLLQYYVDVKLLELDGGDVRAQYGRMTLKYADQHLISPLGWSNTFRNFEGGKLYYSGENWDVDGFSVRPNNGAASGSTFQPESFDSADQSVLFSGVYATYKKAKHGKVDLFWLWNKESQPSFAPGFGFNRQDGSRHTIGGRYVGKIPVKDGKTTLRTYTWDVQGAWQLGEDNFATVINQDVSAGFLSAISGVTFDDVLWSPTVNGLFWWGSGDDDPTDGKNTTVNTLYPLGHAYWGQIDNLNGANLLDYSVQVSVKPAKKLTLAAHMHWFDKANANDYIYNVAGAPLGGTTTADRHIGNELDLLATYQVSKNLQVQAGYFWFWYGDAVSNQAGLRRDDAQQFYLMTTYGF